MDQDTKIHTDEKIAEEKRVLALSWSIATEPKLYRELAPNPYARETTKLLAKRFPDISTAESIKAVILAEPEGGYERDFKKLEATEQVEALCRQADSAAEIQKRLIHYCKAHVQELSELSKDEIYSSLSLIVFGTTEIQEIEQNYAQKQRRELKLAMVHFIETLATAGIPPKKTIRSKKLPKVILLTLFLLLLFSLAEIQTERSELNQTNKKQVLATKAQNENEGFPMRLKIPVLNVDSSVEYVGLTDKGAMAVPSNTVDVGWFKFGAYPGENGSAVIAGHYDGEDGTAGIFANLDKLKKGDKIFIDYANGISLVFVVSQSRTYNPGYAEDVFNAKDSRPHLNLITCDGVWDKTKKSYSKRLVVFADSAH